MSASPQTAQFVGVFDGPYYLSMAGHLVESQDSFDVINPATGEILAKAPVATAEQLGDAIAAATVQLSQKELGVRAGLDPSVGSTRINQFQIRFDLVAITS